MGKRTRRRDPAAYQAHINGAEWRAFRAQILKERGGRCEACRATGPMPLHHLTYANFGNERSEDVAVLCVECHEATHGRYDSLFKRVKAERRAFVNAFQARRKEAKEAAAKEQRKAVVAARVAAWMAGEGAAPRPTYPNGVRRRPATPDPD